MWTPLNIKTVSPPPFLNANRDMVFISLANFPFLYEQLQAALVDRRRSVAVKSDIPFERLETCDMDYATDSSNSVPNSPSRLNTNVPASFITHGPCRLCHVSSPHVEAMPQECLEQRRARDIAQQQLEALQLEETMRQSTIDTLQQRREQQQASLERHTLDIASLQHDLLVLKAKCLDEVTQIQDIQRSKETVKRELEDLGQRLFEEAREMVAIEQLAKGGLQQALEKTQKELDACRTALADTEADLRLLRSQMEQPQVKVLMQTALLDSIAHAQLDLLMMHNQGVQVDCHQDLAPLQEFGDFVKAVGSESLRKLHSMKFMKMCAVDDIEPCLRFGPNPRLTSRKIMDAMLVKSCFLEECPTGFAKAQAARLQKEEATASLWERFASSPIFSGCQACGRDAVESGGETEVLTYRFRISYFDEWACIDRYCRDRLVAVMEFYIFIRHLRAGNYQYRLLTDLYQEYSRLKLQMFISR